MVSALARNWWLFALRGLAAILFGILAFVWPGVTLTVLILLFGAYALVDGIFAIVEGVSKRAEESRWWMLVLEGIVGVLAGLAAFFWPGITALALVFLIAAWAVVTGLFEIIAAIRLRKEIEGEWLLGLAGVLSVLFGVALAAFPGAGALALLWLIAGYAIVFGVLVIILAFRLRSWNTRQEAAGSAR